MENSEPTARANGAEIASWHVGFNSEKAMAVNASIHRLFLSH